MFEAYSVAVRVSLINGVTSGLMNISRAFAKTHGDAAKLQRQLDAIKLKLVAGAALAGTGLFGLSLVGKTLPFAKEYVHQLAQMNVAGMRQAEIARSVQAAWAAASVAPTSSAAENLAAIRELRMVFGNTNDAVANMPVVQQLQAILANVKGVTNTHDEAYTVAKALEMKGAVRTPGEFRIEADMMAKAIVASGGKVGAQDFLSTFKYGRSATIGWDRHFAFEILPTLIQEMKNSGGSGGAGGPGNALMSVYDKVINGRIAQKDLPIWQQLGLLDPSKIVYTKTHSAKGALPEAVTGYDLFQRDPYAWTQSVLMPALRSHGIDDPGKQQMYLSRLGGTRTAAFMLQQMGLQGWKFDRDVPLIRGAEGLDAYKTLLKNDPMMAQLALQKQWQNLLAVIGYQILPSVVNGTLHLVTWLRELANVMRAHPTLTKALVVGFTALSAAMAFGGMVILLSAAFDAVGLAVPVVLAGVKGLASAARLFPVGTLGKVAQGVVSLGTASTDVILGVESIGTSLVALAGIISAVVAPALALITGGALIYTGWKYHHILGNLGQSSVTDLLGALGNARTQEQTYRDQLAHHGIDAKTANRFIDQWSGQAATIAKELQRRGVPVPGVIGSPAAPHLSAPPAHSAVKPSAYTGRSPFEAPRGAQKVAFSGDVYIDGHRAGEVIWRHQADALERNSAAVGADFDPRMALAPVGLDRV